MQTKTLTPMQLWQDFNPVKEQLQLNILSNTFSDNINCTEYAFNAVYATDGAVRTTVTVFRKTGTTNLPVILVIPDYHETFDLNTMQNYLSLGFAVVTFDYTGIAPNKKRFTKYPPSLAYGNLSLAGDKLAFATNGANNTSLFLWSKIARRVITLIAEIPYLDDSRIGGLAWGHAANILWQVAGMDGRIKTIAPFLNGGWNEYKGYDKFSETSDPSFNDERSMWHIGCSIPSYAKFITASILFIGATNNDNFSYDRVSDTMKLLPPTTERFELMSAGASNQVDKDKFLAAAVWFEDKLIKNVNITPPTLTLKAIENALEVDLSCDSTYSNIIEATLYTAHGESSAFLRSWIASSISVGLVGEGKTTLKIYDLKERIYLFANIKYKNGFIVSTPLTTLIPSELGDFKLSPLLSRIIFERKMGANMFFLKSKGNIADQSLITFANGPLDISGVTTSSGDLICYNIGDVKNQDVETVLQFDAFSSVKKEINITLTDFQKNEFSTKVTLANFEEWSKVMLSISEFKNKDLFSLKNWLSIKFITFSNISNVLLNNILWV